MGFLSDRVMGKAKLLEAGAPRVSKDKFKVMPTFTLQWINCGCVMPVCKEDGFYFGNHLQKEIIFGLFFNGIWYEKIPWGKKS